MITDEFSLVDNQGCNRPSLPSLFLRVFATFLFCFLPFECCATSAVRGVMMRSLSYPTPLQSLLWCRKTNESSLCGVLRLRIFSVVVEREETYACMNVGRRANVNSFFELLLSENIGIKQRN